jgi:Raf kinase inhibitor-like YbhB/YbcL family protein
MVFVSIGVLILFGVSGCGGGNGDNDTTGPTTSLTITSTAFASGAAIPAQYTCDGNDISPPLQWSGVPQGTQSLALILDDPDAPGGTFVHWVLFSMPATTTGLAEGSAPGGALPAGSVEGINDFGNLSYGGPCPPPGSNHRYYFRLYALDTALTLAAGVSRNEVDQAMTGRILAQTELMGTYAR